MFRIPPRIPASCTVDDLGAMQYAVEVQGALAFADYKRTYLLKAKSEDEAARDGLNQFVAEMEALIEDD